MLGQQDQPQALALGRGEGARELERRRQRYFTPDELGERRQRSRGLLLPRERIELLLDPGSEWPFGYSLAHDGYVFGFGEVDGRPVAYRTWDPTIRGAAAGWAGQKVSHAHMALVQRGALPVFNLTQSAGGTMDLSSLSSSFAGGFKGALMGSRRAAPMRGVVLTAVLGASFAPWTVPFADYAVMTRSSAMAFVNPTIVEQATGIRTPLEEIGGADVHFRQTGQVDDVSEDEPGAIALLRKAFTYLPGNPWERSPVRRNGDPAGRLAPELRDIVPAYPNRPYDARKVIEAVVDRGSFMEWGAGYGGSVVTGLARMDGQTVGVLASQPSVMAGSLTAAALIKATRVLHLLGELRIPLVTFADTPGALTTKDEEHKRLLAVVTDYMVARLRLDAPKVTVITGKAIGLAYFAFGGTDPEGVTLAWPNAQISYIGPEGGVRIAYRRELAEADNAKAMVDELAEPFRRAMNPWRGASTAGIDDIIDPVETRPRVIRALRALERRGDKDGRRYP